MNENIQTILHQISGAASDDDFPYILDEKIEELKAVDSNGESVGALLEFMEKNPLLDFGMPGSIVHFVERFYRKGYEEKLLESLERCPVSHTVWMLNRIINGSPGVQRSKYQKAMEDVLVNSKANDETKESARGFLLGAPGPGRR